MGKSIIIVMAKRMANIYCTNGCQVLVDGKYYDVKGGSYEKVVEHFKGKKVKVVDKWGVAMDVAK